MIGRLVVMETDHVVMAAQRGALADPVAIGPEGLVASGHLAEIVRPETDPVEIGPIVHAGNLQRLRSSPRPSGFVRAEPTVRSLSTPLLPRSR